MCEVATDRPVITEFYYHHHHFHHHHYNHQIEIVFCIIMKTLLL